MRNLWFRIGLGAAAVFVVGMFAISLGRHVKAQVASAMTQGGRVAVPLAMLPFKVGQDKIGSIRQVDVQRAGPGEAKRITIMVKMKEPHGSREYANCLFKVDAPEADGLFACVPEGSADAEGLVKIGEIRLEPGSVHRPLVISKAKAGDWYDGRDGTFNMQAGDQGVTMHASDENGSKVVELRADSNGAYLQVQDQNGKKVVRIQAGSGGVQVDVKKDSATP